MRSAWSCLMIVCCASTAYAAPGEGSFTPQSLLVPLRGVALQSSSGGSGAAIYNCNPGTHGVSIPAPVESDAGDADEDAAVSSSPSAPSAPSDCLVDMADNAALAALFEHDAAIPVGTYDQVGLFFCAPGETGYTTYVRGEVVLASETYYTSMAHGGVLSTSSAETGYVPLPHAGCGATVPLAAPIEVRDGESIALAAFFTLRNITWATRTGEGPPGGCAFDASHTESVCTSYPIPVPHLGSLTPTLDLYYITEDQSDLTASKAGGQLLLLRDAAGVPFGGFTRRLYSETSVNPTVNYDTPLKTIMANPDSTYLIENWGGGAPGGPPLAFYVRFPAFELHDHNGMLVRASDSAHVNYRAVKQ